MTDVGPANSNSFKGESFSRESARSGALLDRSLSKHPGRWSTITLSASAGKAEIDEGFALLWPTECIKVHHVAGAVSVGTGDLVIVDRTKPLSCVGNDDWQAKILNFGDRRLKGRLGERQPFVGLPVNSDNDLGRIIKQLWLMLVDIPSLRFSSINRSQHVIED